MPDDGISEMSLPPEEPPPLPGGFLREAREARKLTVFEVAQSLKFSPRQIEALEADDFAALPAGSTFQRGFVRSYAKLLKLDPAPLLAMLDAQMPAAPADVRAPQNMGVAATPVAAGSRSSRPMLYGSAVLAVLAIVLAGWHYLGGPTLDTMPSKSAPASTETPAPVAPAPETAINAPDIRVEPAPAATPGAEPGTPAASPATQAPPATIPPDTHQLVFVFQEKSWVEVTDATHRVVFSAENAAGTRQAVSGKPPFQVVIGNAAKVELTYDDRQIDLKPYTRAEVARLTLE
ncbi:MAG TPA: RodZ domain-containing protein [Rhodocyclaceae bacterium]